MAMEADAARARIRWGRALLAAFAAELVLIVPTIAIFSMSADPTPLLNAVIPPAAMVAFVPAGYWTARPEPRAAILNGAVPGVIGVALYVILTLIMSGAVADFDLSSSVRPAYLLAHALKIVGGLIGGWLVTRRVRAAGM